MLGGAVGTVAHHLLPGYTAAPGAYALVGMGALFAGIVRAPMTSVLMIFEMTRDYAVIVPLMIANMTSLFISSRFEPDPIYESLAHQDGIQLPTPEERGDSNGRTIQHVMQSSPQVLPADISVAQALEQTQSSDFATWPVADKSSFLGLVTTVNLERAVAEGNAERPLRDLVNTLGFPYFHTDQPLFLALERMSKSHLDVAPVVHRADAHKLVGILTLRDVMDAYGID
jgi:CIC family chloride channel protein